MNRALPALVLLVAVACGSKSPAGPSNNTPPPTPTKIIRMFGSMAYGDVQLGQSKTNVLTIVNDGTASLTITGMTASGGMASVLSASPQTGTILPNGSLQVTIRFTPAAATGYSGAINVASDATSGTNSIAISGAGTLDGLPIYRNAGTNNTVFDMPFYVTRVRIIGLLPSNCSNFIVRIAGRLIVNEIIGTCGIAIGPRYDGTHLLSPGGGTVEITNSSGVTWLFEEIR